MFSSKQSRSYWIVKGKTKLFIDFAKKIQTCRLNKKDRENLYLLVISSRFLWMWSLYRSINKFPFRNLVWCFLLRRTDSSKTMLENTRRRLKVKWMQKSEKFNMKNKIFRLSGLSTVNLTNKKLPSIQGRKKFYVTEY